MKCKEVWIPDINIYVERSFINGQIYIFINVKYNLAIEL